MVNFANTRAAQQRQVAQELALKLKLEAVLEFNKWGCYKFL